MRISKRNFIISSKHRRLTRLWQFFFTGWGLVMVASLVAGALFSRQILWTPISAINMTDIASNQFKMTNATFAGTDEKGEPFTIRATTARQEYDSQNLIYLDNVSGTIVQTTDGKAEKRDLSAKNGIYNRTNKTITLTGNVKVISSSGDKILTKKLVIKI